MWAHQCKQAHKHTYTHKHTLLHTGCRWVELDEMLGPIISESVYFCPLTAGDRLNHYVLMNTICCRATFGLF